MNKGRLEAFSDGVIAIIITIMVLELKVPHHADSGPATLADLRPLLPVFLSYVLSFLFVGIYWNNHHHLFQLAKRVSARVLWANLHLLFWLSLIPFTTGWLGETHFAAIPVAVYGTVLLMSALAYCILQWTIQCTPDGEVLTKAVGRDVKGKLSLLLFTAAIALSFVAAWLACTIYFAVVLMWLIPDRRIERALANETKSE